MKFFAILVFLLVGFATFGEAQQKPEMSFSPIEQDVTNLGNKLLQALAPTLPENAYMPMFMKEKITWLYTLSEESKRLTGQEVLALVKGEAGYGKEFMRTFYTSRTYPHVEIVSNMLFYIVRVQDRVPIGFTQKNKNDFGVALVHETVHLEQPRSYFTRPSTQKQKIEEEFRTWSKVDKLVVGPLIKIGQPLDTVYLSIHDALVACNYRMPCEVVTRNITRK